MRLLPFAGEHNMKYYTIYRITNTTNGKAYIGKHVTSKVDDDYMGSGKHLKRAIAKYGAEHFCKTILHVYSTEAEMNARERELVTEAWCLRDDTYNLCVGGQGGFSYINRTRNHAEHSKKAAQSRDYSQTDWSCNKDELKRKHKAEKQRHGWISGKYSYIPSTKGLTFSAETKKKMSKAGSGKNNSQFGKVWITDGFSNKKISATDGVPTGWRLGRVPNKHVGA